MIAVDKQRGLFRGPRPASLHDLRKEGIRRMISFEGGTFDLMHPSGILLRQFPCDFGMDQYDMKCSNIFPPEYWVIEKVVCLMLQDPKPTYMHCLKGVDRTGFVAAGYKKRLFGWRNQTVIDEWKALGRHPWFFWWERSLREFV